MLLLAYSAAYLNEKPVFHKGHKKNITVSPIVRPSPLSMPLPQMWYGHIKSTVKLPILIHR
jgi:hypothetical protein